MTTLVTIKNIGRQIENIPGGPLAIGDTLVVDLDDEAVRKELRNDHDYIVLPDSAAGNAAPSGIVAFDSSAPFVLGDGVMGGDVETPIPGLSLDYESNELQPLLLTVTIPDLIILAPAGVGAGAQVNVYRDGLIAPLETFTVGVEDDDAVSDGSSVHQGPFVGHVLTDPYQGFHSFTATVVGLDAAVEVRANGANGAMLFLSPLP